MFQTIYILPETINNYNHLDIGGIYLHFQSSFESIVTLCWNP